MARRRGSRGEALRAYRMRAGLTQQELASRAGVSLRALRDIEHDRVGRPRPESLHRFAEALKLTDDERDTMVADAGSAAAAARLAVDVLGPLRVRLGAADVDVAAAMQRRLLALLALHPGQTVPYARLAEGLWAGDPPTSWMYLTHRYARQLGDLLDPDRPPIVRRGGGYRLDLPAERLDLARFDDLVSRAADLDAEQAWLLLADALRCWRGPVLADEGPQLAGHPAAVAANQRRVDAALAFADLAVERGTFHPAVADLRAVALDQPLHEGLQARLMLVLAGAGEQAGALELYDAVQARLVDELGVEPGEELRSARLRVLRQELPATRAPTARAGPDRPAPSQLPAEPTGFAGRRDQLRRLDARPPHGRRVWVVTGAAGVGKTALAVHWAHSVADRFPDGRLYVNLRGFDPSARATAPTDAVRGFLDALGVPPERIPPDLDAQAALYRSTLADKRMLVVLDNARDVDQVRPLLPGTPTATVVVTSRSKLTGLVATDGARIISLDLLSPQDARRMMSRRLGADRVAAEADATGRIIEACARLPLALAIAAARAWETGFPLAAVADELQHADQRLNVLDTGDPAGQIRATFSWSYEALAPRTARLFRLLGLHPGPDISVPAAAGLAGEPVARTRGLLTELTRANLLTEHAPGRYTFHDLLRVYATELTEAHDPAPERHEATARLLDHYVHTAHAAALMLDHYRDVADPPGPAPGAAPELLTDREQALAWQQAERQVLVAAVDHAARRGLETRACLLAIAIETLLDRQGYLVELTAVQTTALAAADRLGDAYWRARAHRGLALAYLRSGRFDEAQTHLGAAYDLFEGDPAGQGSILMRRGWVLDHDGRHEEARGCAERALDLFLQAGDRGGQSHARSALGWSYAAAGDYRRALTHCERALALYQELGNRYGESVAWDSLGFVHHHLGDHAEAIACYGRSLRLGRSLGNRIGEATILDHLGDTLQAAGDPAAAREAWQTAVGILRESGSLDADRIDAKLRSRGD
jgi:DNA-binding SARP family transcriptional activator/tetratricopeptide (TPR) repeat protein/DNA-binding XRE family transcriptional regulator